MSSINVPYILKVPFTVPKAKAKDINLLSLKIILIDFLKSMFYIIEPKDGNVGGLSLKKITTNNTITADIIASTRSSMKNYAFICN
jgi:hypothetical protein